MKRFVSPMILAFVFLLVLSPIKTLAYSDPDNALKVQAPDQIQIHYKVKYMDGVVIERVTKRHILALDDFLAQHEDWQLVKKLKDDLFLVKNVDDLSPVSKAVGIFGLKDGNILTLFKGDPQHNEVIQTFFQIDIKALQAKDIRRLKKGIRVHNKQQFQEMIHSLSNFAVSKKEQRTI